MGELLSRLEAKQQRIAVQQLLMQAAAEPVGLLLTIHPPSDTEYFVDLIYRAKYKDPYLRHIEARVVSGGVALCHSYNQKDLHDDTQVNLTNDTPPYSDL